MKEHAALVIRNRDEVLFIKRSLKKKTLPGAWSFPSGTVEEGEEVKDTVVREAKEELDVLVEPREILAIKDLNEFSVRLIFVNCEVKEGESRVKERDEIRSIEWMSFNEFFNRFKDDEIGHGLVWLRKNKELVDG